MKIENLKLKILFDYWYLLVVFVVFVYIGSILAQRASAQRTITIVPPTIQQILDPGGTAEGMMKVINNNSETLTFNTTIQDYAVFDTKGTPNLFPLNTFNEKYSAASWIGITPETFTVLPHQKQILNYYLKVPLGARPGGHYTAITFTPINSDGILGTGASVQEKIGALFYITVNGIINEHSAITKFSTNPFSEYGPIEIQTQIKNLGDLHIIPQGKIIVSDFLGRTIQESELSKFNIFPLSARDYVNTIGQKLMVGRFKVALLASYGKNNNLPLAATIYFWVLPWKIAILIILTITAIVLGITYWRKERRLPKPLIPKTDA